MNISNLFRISILIISLIGISFTAAAYDFVADGIYYNINNDGTSVSVTGGVKKTGDLIIPATVTYSGKTFSVTSIGDNAFSGFAGLTSVTIGDSISTIGKYAFQGCTGLNTLYYYAISCNDFAPYFAAQERMSPFCNLNISTIKIGDGVKRIPSCFAYELTKLIGIDIPNSVTNIGFGAFCGCTGLTSINIPNSVTGIGQYAFGSCTGLTSVNLPNSILELASSVFRNCSGLTSITIPNSVKYIDYGAFESCTGLTQVHIPNSVIEIAGLGPWQEAHGAFENCSNLTEVIIGENVEVIESYVFRGCSKLSSIIIPNSVKSIGRETFADCYSLSNVTIGNSVKTIDSYAFSNCPFLDKVIIGNSVYSIKEGAFKGCTNLSQVICKGYMPPNYEPENGDYPLFEDIVYRNAVLYVPDLTQGYYLQTEPWKHFMEVRLEPYDYNGVSFSTSVYPTSIRMEAVNIVGTQLANDYFTFEGVKYNPLVVTGLDPTSIYSGTYTMKTATETVEIPFKFYTSRLKMVAEGARILDATSALLKAETNLADEEMICGFDWRRYEGPEDYLGTRVYCPVYDGTMAGTLKNLARDTYYKYRPVYKSSANNVYYGDWVTFYTGDVGVEFDPVVYTYNSPEVTQTSAVLQGVALRGSDEITEQGFEYWRKNGTVGKVTATGERMSANVTGLQPGTSYTFRAYLKAGGKTAYGTNVEFVTVAGGLDVNADGVVNIADINVIINYILSGNQNKQGDVNGDGVVNIADVNLIINDILSH